MEPSLVQIDLSLVDSIIFCSLLKRIIATQDGDELVLYDTDGKIMGDVITQIIEKMGCFIRIGNSNEAN
jgi:hypothetical protein